MSNNHPTIQIHEAEGTPGAQPQPDLDVASPPPTPITPGVYTNPSPETAPGPRRPMYHYDYLERNDIIEMRPGWLLYLPKREELHRGWFVDPRIPSGAYGTVMVTWVGRDWVNVVLCTDFYDSWSPFHDVVFPPDAPNPNMSKSYPITPTQIPQGNTQLRPLTDTENMYNSYSAGIVNFTVDPRQLMVKRDRDRRMWVADLAMFYQKMSGVGEDVRTDHRG